MSTALGDERRVAIALPDGATLHLRFDDATRLRERCLANELGVLVLGRALAGEHTKVIVGEGTRASVARQIDEQLGPEGAAS